MSKDMADVIRQQLNHAAESHRINRTGWTRDQWVADARRLFNDLDGSVLDLVNGHVSAMLAEIDELRSCCGGQCGRRQEHT